MKLKQYLSEETYEVKSITGKSMFKTDIAPENRELSNLPRDGKKNAKVKFQDWLVLDGKKGANGKYYGWSHRAIYGFGVGDVIKPDTIGYQGNGNEYTLKTDQEAMEQAKRFADEVS